MNRMSLQPELIIRAAEATDADAIQRLCLQLGYEPSLKTVERNLLAMSEHPDYEVLCATLQGTVVGFMNTSVRHRIVGLPFLQIQAIVTDESVRGKGYGRALMACAEDRARSFGIDMIGLYSQTKRIDAHGFYEGIGYARDKESYFFKKQI
jgi:GNAT superfamily N-acetyltransferase